MPTGPVAPPADSMGRVHFGPASGQGLGRVTVNAPAADKLQVSLDGRYFGNAPITIYSVPKGDYIVEGAYPDGKQVSRPVTVSENEEAVVDLAAGNIPSSPGAPTANRSGTSFVGQIFPWDNSTTRILLIAGAVSLVAGITFGILELKDESDYQNSPDDPAMLDDIAKRGRRDAIIANVGFIAAGGCLIAAAVVPLLTKPSTPEKTDTAFVVTPVVGPGMTGGAFALRF